LIIGKLYLNGVEYFQSKDLTIFNSRGEYNSVSNFKAIFDSGAGIRKDDFTINDEIEIYSNTTKIFKGNVDDIGNMANENTGTITISGKDKGTILIDSTVEPVIFNNTEISAIVLSLMGDVPELTTNNVNATGIEIDKIQFNHTSVFDALKRLAELAGFYFYVDVDGDLHFELKGSISSGVTLDSTNIISSNFQVNDDEVINRVWVYGSKIFTKVPTQDFIANGGSEYSLTYSPYNTDVNVSGTHLNGGILNATNEGALSGVQYLVDFSNSNIVFVSGTASGYNIPTSGEAFTIDYDRGQAIVKFAQDSSSVISYGRKEQVITDKEITDPVEARDRAKQIIKESADALMEGILISNGIEYLVPGNTILVNLPKQNENNNTYEINKVVYKFNTKTSYSGNVVTISLSQKIKGLTDTLKQIINDIRKIQTGDTGIPDFITRLETSYNDINVLVKKFILTKKDYSAASGSVFLFGNSTFGQAGNDMITYDSTYTPVLSTLEIFNYNNTFEDKYYDTIFVDTDISTALLDSGNGQVIF